MYAACGAKYSVGNAESFGARIVKFRGRLHLMELAFSSFLTQWQADHLACKHGSWKYSYALLQQASLQGGEHDVRHQTLTRKDVQALVIITCEFVGGFIQHTHGFQHVSFRCVRRLSLSL